MSVFKKQGIYWIDCYVKGHHGRVGSGGRLTEPMQRKLWLEK
jgi:hypothetical protein